VSEAAPSITAPEPGSAAELATFRDLQSRVAVHFLWPFAVIVEGGTWGVPSAEGSVSF